MPYKLDFKKGVRDSARFVIEQAARGASLSNPTKCIVTIQCRNVDYVKAQGVPGQLDGYYCPSKRLIVVACGPRHTLHRIVDTFYHEWIHALQHEHSSSLHEDGVPRDAEAMARYFIARMKSQKLWPKGEV